MRYFVSHRSCVLGIITFLLLDLPCRVQHVVEMPDKQQFLLIDISNSNTKMILSSESSLLGDVFSIPTSEFCSDTFNHLPWGIDKKELKVVISSVVPEKNPFIEGSFESEKVLYVSNQIKLGCGIDYTKPESIGADRLANTVGAIHFIGAPAIVVDFGTALTFDVISREKAYIGGVIAPGLAAMTDYMHDNTALLPKIDLNEPLSVIGKTTEAAMLSGAVIGYRGLVRQILSSLMIELGESNVPVVATGGYSKLISRGIEEIIEVNEKLTLEGLRIIAKLNN